VIDSGSARTSHKTVGLSAYGVIFTGLALVLLSVLGGETWHWPAWVTNFVRDLGLLLAAVTAATIFHEKLLRDEMFSSFNKELDEKLQRVTLDTAEEVHRLFSERPPLMTGLRKLSDRRRGFSGYYNWINEQKPQELFFAGRSVLHRMDADIRSRTAGTTTESAATAADILLRRLREGSKIHILFLDPRTNMLARLADEEGQTPAKMLGDIKISLEICSMLADLLNRHWSELPPGAELSIRVYDRVPYFAYHKQDGEVIVGFYFHSSRGYTSAAYELIDDETKEAFEGHFIGIRGEAAKSAIVEFDGARGKPNVSLRLVEDLLKSINAALNEG
jgi:hypothetical protein